MKCEHQATGNFPKLYYKLLDNFTFYFIIIPIHILLPDKWNNNKVKD